MAISTKRKSFTWDRKTSGYETAPGFVESLERMGWDVEQITITRYEKNTAGVWATEAIVLASKTTYTNTGPM